MKNALFIGSMIVMALQAHALPTRTEGGAACEYVHNGVIGMSAHYSWSNNGTENFSSATVFIMDTTDWRLRDYTARKEEGLVPVVVTISPDLIVEVSPGPEDYSDCVIKVLNQP